MDEFKIDIFQPEETTNPVKVLHEIADSVHREEIIKTINEYRSRLDQQKTDRRRLKLRYKLFRLLDMAYKSQDLTKIEKELCAMAGYLEAPSLQIQRYISLTILLYTVFSLVSFVTITLSESLMLPSFNIPYTVLLMGLIGCLVSMYVKLPGIKKHPELTSDITVWFIISPPIAVIMAGLFFGFYQILLSSISVDISDEYWFYWIFSWVVGFINWVSLYEKLTKGIKRRSPLIENTEKCSENNIGKNDKFLNDTNFDTIELTQRTDDNPEPEPT